MGEKIHKLIIDLREELENSVDKGDLTYLWNFGNELIVVADFKIKQLIKKNIN